MLTPIIGVIILLGGLIFFHELGHYSVAKFFKVKVEIFSLGFGKKILRKKVGETEYCLSLVPLGGYVKLMGDDPYKPVPAADAERAFSTQKLYKRFAIVAAGPLSNLLLAYALFVAIFYFGQPMAGTRIGSVIVGSPAWEAGIRAKDRVTEVDSHPVKSWNELEDSLRHRLDQKVELRIDRAGQELRIPYVVQRVRARNPYGEEEEIGGIKGVSPSPMAPVVGISNPESPAYKAGMRTGDQIVKIEATELNTFEDINDVLARSWKDGQPLTFSVKRPDALKSDVTTDHNFSVVLPAKPAADKLSGLGLSPVIGFYPSEVFVRKVSEDSPAQKGGLLNGDRIVKVGNDNVYHFESIVDRVQEEGKKGNEVAFTVERDGKPVVLNLKPLPNTSEDPITRMPVTKFLVGFVPATAYAEPEIIKFRITSPGPLIAHAFSETNLLAKRMVISIWKLMSRQISAKNLGGPIMIANVAGKSLEAGFVPFLQTMALISLNLFLLNLLPVPVLDGGHLLFFAIESVKGKPVSIRTMELATQVGMVLILALVGLTLFNDITRIVLH